MPWHLPATREPNTASKRGQSAQTAIGCVHLDRSERRLGGGKLNIVLAVNRVGQAGRMSRPVKDVTIRASHDPDLERPKAHVLAFVSAHNFTKHLKALQWRTPFKAVRHAWTTTFDVLKPNPRHPIPRPNT